MFISEGRHPLLSFYGGGRLSKHSKRAHMQKRKQEAPRAEKERGTPQERQTFKKLQEQYGEFSQKRPRYIKYGLMSIFILPLVFLVLMFSLESKLVFLTLWIISIIACAAFLVIVEYKDYWYRKLLGLDEEPDDGGKEEQEEPQAAVEPDRTGPETGIEESGERASENGEAGNIGEQCGAGSGPKKSTGESMALSRTQGETKV